MQRMRKELQHWKGGVRLYISIGTILVIVQSWWWANAAYGNNTPLSTLRLEEVYAWIAVGLLTIALAIGPVYRLRPRLPGRALMRDARRLIGVSAGTFAFLHVLLAYGIVLHWVNPLTLAGSYRIAVLAGIIAMLVLLAMVLTSFDAAFKSLGVWWFRLHRLVYLAGFLVVVHALLIGSHTVSWSTGRWILIAGMAVISILHATVLWKGRGHER